jgi:hypothetical protein
MQQLQINLLLALLFIIVGCSNEDDKNSSEIAIGKIESIKSEVLKEDRKFWVHVPDGYDQSDSSKRYPVLYLLDGDAHFYSVVGMMHQLSTVNGNDVCPKMIVVGIPNTNRTRDLTPTLMKSDKADSSFFKISGGGEKFTEFIGSELIPYMEKNYPCSKERLLVGHSLGGLLVLNTMLKHSELFNKYIAIDPSLWWDDQKSLKEYQIDLQQKNFQGKSLFLGVANTTAMDTSVALQDTTEETLHFRSIWHFTKALKQTNENGLESNSKYYRDESHGSVPFISEYDALHFLFRKKPIVMGVSKLKLFEGKYKHQFVEGEDSFLEIRASESHLILKELWGGRELKFKPISETEFYCFEQAFPLKFIKDDKGIVKQVLAFNSDMWDKTN